MKILYTSAIVVCFLVLNIFVFIRTDLHKSHNKELAICPNPIAFASLEPAYNPAQSATNTTWILDTSAWPARWSCGEWTTFQGWTSILSDIVIFISYFGIPIGIIFFLYRTKIANLTFRKLLILFILFILSCGLTHLIDAIIFWKPVYNLSISMKFLTAVISATTFFSLVRATPKLLRFKSPEQLEKIIQEQTAELTYKNSKLELEIDVRKKTEQELNKALSTNKDLYRENQHRMKNNLQMISSLLFIRSADKSEQVKLDFHEIAERISSINKVNELLLKEDPASEINVSDYFEKMTAELCKIYHVVTVNMELDIPNDFKLVASYVMTCGLIYSEFFSNSIKHAFADTEKPTITLAFKTDDDAITMLIKDNGSGYDTSINKPGSFGVGLIESFIRELNGSKSIESKPNQGTALEVKFSTSAK